MRERSGSSGGWGAAGGGLGVWGFGQPRVRRSSSKDVEEAMACGMSKVKKTINWKIFSAKQCYTLERCK